MVAPCVRTDHADRNPARRAQELKGHPSHRRVERPVSAPSGHSIRQSVSTNEGCYAPPVTALDVRYLDALHAEIPGLRVINKAQDPLSRWIDRALLIVTFGGQREFMTRYVTTIGRTIFLPSGWGDRSPESRYVTLRHEAVHLRQFRRYGLVLTALVYLVPFLPLGLAWGRARLEWEAYAETLRATAEVYGLDAASDPKLHAYLRRQFTGPAYGWMWPFERTVQRWIDRSLAELALESGPGDN